MPKETTNKTDKSEKSDETLEEQLRSIRQAKADKYKLFRQQQKETQQYQEKLQKREELINFITELSDKLFLLVQFFKRYQFPKINEDIYASELQDKYFTAVNELEGVFKKSIDFIKRWLEKFEKEDSNILMAQNKFDFTEFLI